MDGEKPVYVYHDQVWRIYRWSRSLLDRTCLGDVIPGVESDLSDDPASAHIYSRSDAAADIVSAEPPGEALWKTVSAVVAGRTDSIGFPDPFA